LKLEMKSPHCVNHYRSGLLFRNGHLSTAFAGLLRPEPRWPAMERTRLELPDGDFLDVDGYGLPAQRVLVVLHGLEGNSRRPYVGHMVRRFLQAGWGAVALNLRGCSGEPNRFLRGYHSGDTGDLTFLIHWLLAQKACRELALVGFSLGGNVVMKYLGDAGTGLPPEVRAGVGFSVPCNLTSACQALDTGMSRVYVRRFLRTLIPKALAKAARFPGLLDPEAIRSARSLEDYDNAVTAPSFGFRDARDYWARASSLPVLERIAVPALIVNALDDPFLGEGCYPDQELARNPRLNLEIPRFGGHIAFPRLTWRGHYWSEDKALAFCEAAVGR
jgi:uncharacterized protein